MKIHLDTDFAGDPDDACALAMLCGSPEIELVAVTTVADPDGRRASYARLFLDRLGRRDVPVLAGAGVSMTGPPMGDIPEHERYWDATSWLVRQEPGDILSLLDRSIEMGATIIAIGPATNLSLLEWRSPGYLADATVVMMGGWLSDPRPGMPTWGPSADWNVNCDPEAFEVLVREAGSLTLMPLPAAMEAQLRERDLPRLRASGRIGELLARQAVAYAEDTGKRELPTRWPALPSDLLNFHWDPVACAVALGWEETVVEQVAVATGRLDGSVRLEARASGRTIGVCTSVDGPAFTERWLAAVEGAQGGQ